MPWGAATAGAPGKAANPSKSRCLVLTSWAHSAALISPACWVAARAAAWAGMGTAAPVLNRRAATAWATAGGATTQPTPQPAKANDFEKPLTTTCRCCGSGSANSVGTGSGPKLMPS